MSDETIKKFYIAFEEKNWSACQEMCHKDVEWITAKDISYGGTFKGVKEVFEKYFPYMLSSFREFYIIPNQITLLKEHVMVNGEYKGVSKSNKDFKVPFSHIFLIQGNKIIQFREFVDTKIIKKSLS